MEEHEKTPLPFPKQSYSQELLNKPVPLENRIEVLSAYVLPTIKVHTLDQLTNQLGISSKKVHEISCDLGIEFVVNAAGVEEYPLFTYELIEEELKWHEVIAQQDEYVSVEMVARIVGRDVHWVSYRANELAVFPESHLTATKRVSLAYPKSLIAQLRHIMLHTLPAGDWSNLSELEEELGKDRQWILTRLRDMDITPQERVSRSNHNITDHYPPSASEHLLKCLLAENVAAGSWITASYIGHTLGRTHHWVTARLVQYESIRELRLDDTMKRSWHYPPEILATLRADSERELGLQPANDYMSVKTLSQKLGRSVLWVRNRVAKIEAIPEQRRNRSNRQYDYYSPDVLELLARISAEEQL